MEMRSLSLCLEAPGSCAAQFIESERRTTANTCVMPAAPAIRNVRAPSGLRPQCVGRRHFIAGRKRQFTLNQRRPSMTRVQRSAVTARRETPAPRARTLRVVDIGPMRRVRDHHAPHVPDRGLKSVEDAVELAGERSPAISRVGALIVSASARENGARFSLIWPSRCGRCRESCCFLVRRPSQPPGPDHVDRGPDPRRSRRAGCAQLPGVKRPQRDRRARRPRRLEVGVQRAARLDQAGCGRKRESTARPGTRYVRRGNARADGPVPRRAPRSSSARRRCAAAREIVALAVPMFRPATPEARRRSFGNAPRTAASARSTAVVAERPMHENQGAPVPRSTNAMS